MSNFLKSLSIASAAIGASIVTAGVAQAAPNNTEVLDQLNSYSQEGQTSVAQVNSVFQLRDVSPSDWAFDALRNLVEKYNCIVGYPDGTFRGNRPLSRYEFAAGLNACMQQIERLIVGGGTDVDAADITRLRALVQEFEAELATLGARVDDLEGRVDFLEDHQFSTTTKLNGEVIFGLTDSFGDNDNTEVAFGDRVRLTLETSFTGSDTLVTRLAAGNANTFAPEAGGGVGTQTYDTNGNNGVSVDWLAYYFPLKKGIAYVAATGGIHSDYVSTTFGATGLEDFGGGSGALTHQASSSPIYTIGGGAGAGFSSPLGPVAISLGYMAGNQDAPVPSEGNGLFNGDYAALAQVAFSLGQRAELGLTYVNSYNGTGSPLFAFGGGAGARPVVGSAGANLTGLPSAANTYGVQGKFDLSEKVSLAAYGMLSDADLKGDGLSSEDIWSYGLGVGFSDLGKEGNVLGLFAGVPPYVGGNRLGTGNETPLQIEGFYKYQLNDNISITPGVIWLSNPTEGNGDDDTVIGTVRTTFKF